MAITTPISYWKLDGNSNDSVSSNNGTDTAITYSTGNGKIVQGAGHNGSTSTFTLPIVMGTNGSFNLWFKRNDITTNNSSMFGSTKVGTSDYIRINPTNANSIQFVCADEILTPTLTTDTNWHMATITWSSTVAWKAYIDGSLVSTGASIKNPTNTGYNIRTGITSDGLSTYTPGQTWYNGAIDEIGYWNVALTANDINLLYNAGSGNQYPFTENLQTSLLAYYKTDESSGNASDSTTTGATATNNATVTYATGKINNGAIFSGSNYLSVSNTAVQNVSVGISDFTVSCWVKITTNNNNLDGIITFSDRDRGLRLSSTNFEFFMNNASVGIVSISSAMTTNTFYHLVIIRNGSTFTFYKNGTSVGTQTDSTSYEAAVGTFNIGLSRVALARYMTGCVDETGVWLRALTAAEVTQLYNSGAGLQYPFTGSNTTNFFNLM